MPQSDFLNVKPLLAAILDDGFEYTLGPPSSGFSIFLASRTKKVHFIRHAEGHHNVATTETGTNSCLLRGDKPAKDHPLYDSRLTAKGIQQAENYAMFSKRDHQEEGPLPPLILSCIYP